MIRAMELKIVSKNIYQEICGEYDYFYNAMMFQELNKYKVDNIIYMIFSDSKDKLALCAGIKNGVMEFPFSSPFCIFEKTYKHITIEEVDSALELLESYATSIGIKEIFFRLPPNIYDERFISIVQNCLLRHEYGVKCCDLNFYLVVSDLETYKMKLFRNARKNLNTAMKYTFSFQRCESEEERKQAYEVIAINRERKGYPLRMSYDNVDRTKELTQSDFFLLKENNVCVASAIVFRVCEAYYQVIYWGDIAGYESKRPMNYLAYKVYEYYCSIGAKILDIGPSTENSMPNYGLCDFKESIGCDICTKYTFFKRIDKCEGENGHGNKVD